MPYATITGTKRNRAEMRKYGWRLLLTPDTTVRGSMKPRGDERWALDNGAWGCFQRGLPFDAAAFATLLERWSDGADWVVLPDIVAGGMGSLAVSLSWLPRVTMPRLRLLPVQDGMTPLDVRPHLGESVGIFLGGSTPWKLATMALWGELAAEVGCHYHVARVNSRKRIRLASACGAHSFDGTSPTRFGVTAKPLAEATADAAAQLPLFRRTE